MSPASAPNWIESSGSSVDLGAFSGSQTLGGGLRISADAAEEEEEEKEEDDDDDDDESEDVSDESWTFSLEEIPDELLIGGSPVVDSRLFPDKILLIFSLSAGSSVESGNPPGSVPTASSHSMENNWVGSGASILPFFARR